MIELLIAFLLSFTLSVMLMPIIINYFRKKRASQTILHYVESHKEKNGTLTMGGVVFMITTLSLAFLIIDFDTNWIICLLSSVFFGILGLMDDHLKIKYKQNLGLRPYQKIIGQLGISIILALYIYFLSGGGKIFIPFVDKQIDLGFWIIPLILLVMLATTNSVNLTDGLDGLAGNVSMYYLIFFTVITSIVSAGLYNNGQVGGIISDIENINLLSMLFVGSILGFLMFNTNKASIFMGDAGSLCLGGYIGASACILGFELIVPILGFCFVFSALSVILQVVSFKWKKKRIFKMSPFHHHLQMCGLGEPKIVAIYSATTVILGVLCIIFYMV